MKKFIEDLLKTYNKWSFKRVTAMYSLNVAIIYAFIPIVVSTFIVQEFVFWGFLTYSGAMLGMVLKQKIIEKDSTTAAKEEPLTFEQNE